MAADRVRRVLMTADGVGGVWQYTIDLARGLAAHGVAVDVAVMGPALTADQRADARAFGITVIEGAYRLEWMEEPWAEVDAASLWLLDLERARRPDIVHLNGFCHGALPWRAPVVMVGHSCVRSWWRAVHGENAPPGWDTYRRRVRDGLRAAALVVAPTAAMLAELDADYGPLSDTRIVPNGREPFEAAGVEKQEIVVAAGRVWDAAKNLDAVCAAAHDVRWPVYVAGSTDHPSGTCALSGHVHYLGRLSTADVRRWYAAASIYALPARYEPFGLSVLEAAQAGCALVLGDIRSLRENWNGAAVFVPPDNRRAIASAIESLAGDPEARAALGQRAAALAAQFTVDRMVHGYLAAYHAVLRDPVRHTMRAARRVAYAHDASARIEVAS